MAFTADTLLQLVVLVTWNTLVSTPISEKNGLFARFYTSQDVLEAIASAASITFCPGLFEVLQRVTPPTIEWFKKLPTSNMLLVWAVYALSLEKKGCRPRVYIGVGTEVNLGVIHRHRQYDDGLYLPSGVASSLEKGYKITRKGLLCWMPIPRPSLVPLYRLLCYALEASFAFMFWAMNTKKVGLGMAHLCRWDPKTLEYDGVCSHNSLKDPIAGEFDLDDEQLEALAVDREKRRLELKKQNATNYHYKQMEINYDEYMTDACERSIRARANNPERTLENERRRRIDAVENKKHHCELCNLSFTSSNWLAKHEKTAKHLRKLKESDNPFRCAPCNLGFHNISNLRRHNESVRHRRAVTALGLSSSEIAEFKTPKHGIEPDNPVKCRPCGITIHGANLIRHKKTARHLRNVAASTQSSSKLD
jgi:hypothetical protein